MKDIDLEELEMDRREVKSLTSMASLRTRMVGTMLGTLESILRRSRGYIVVTDRTIACGQKDLH